MKRIEDFCTNLNAQGKISQTTPDISARIEMGRKCVLANPGGRSTI